MKTAVQLLCIAMLCAGCILSCRKNDPPPEDPVGPGDTTGAGSSNADSISNHLQFMNAVKKQGVIPKGPAGSSLKTSIKDTLYLKDEVKMPIRFLHMNASENVAGVFIQVRKASDGSADATYYYDVPEVPEMAHNDSVSVVMIGIDADGLPDKETDTFSIIVVPYDGNHQAIGSDGMPVKIDDGAGTCGLVLPPGEYWDWHLSYVLNADGNTFSFYNDHDMIHGAGGQDIGGSCCNGNSYYGICPGDTAPNRKLHFATFFQYAEESFIFDPNGTYARLTRMLAADPAPNESNFCGSGAGVVHERITNVSYFGNWTIQPTTLPPSLQEYNDSLKLTLQGTSSTGFGYGNPGGVIHLLNCNFLTLIQLDMEGGNGHLYKYYTRMTALGAWYLFG